MAEFDFSTEQDELRTGLRRFCERQSDEATVRRLMESDAGYDRALWGRLGSELGALGLAVPDDLGGAGAGLVDQAIAVEELGAALFCGPLLGTVGLAIPALVAAPAGPVRDELLPALAEGTRTAAFVGPLFAPYDPAATTVAAGGSGHHIGAGERITVSGIVEQVPDGGAADVLLVVASGREGPVLVAVDAADARVSVRGSLDLTRRHARVGLDGAQGRVVASGADADRAIRHAYAVAGVLLAAEQVGVAQHLLDVTVGYAKERLQFGRPIGSFQAVKHRCADMLVALEHARSTAYHAAWAVSDPSLDDPELAVAIAQSTCSEACYRIAADAIQMHGGIGFTWEHPAHLYYKRAVADAALLGSAEAYREVVAVRVLDSLGDVRAPTVATG
ncbi:MAG: acyl-CoA/acyl-ACP dehydrogenase [Pseudonocardia sp.]|nr:acyl-CoA/acyl-ACP dehydrogenase [Pseudonocardia sp.]